MNLLFPVIMKINYFTAFLSCHSFCGYCFSLFPGECRMLCSDLINSAEFFHSSIFAGQCLAN